MCTRRINLRTIVRVASIGSMMAGLAVSTSIAQYDSDFEGLTASPTGEVLTGQDGFYLPAGVDMHAFTYAGNALGINANPAGGDQFVAGRGPGDGSNYARAQRDVAWGTGYWEVTYDMAAAFMGVDGSIDNVGSFSVQPYPGSQNYIHLFSFMDATNPVDFRAFYLAYNAAGTAHVAPGESPGSSWESLSMNHWYRFGTVIDFDSNRIVYVWITDLTTGLSDGHCPTDWYLQGGEVGGQPTPTGFRFFAGGGNGSDNVTAWDNMNVEASDMFACLDGECPGDVRLVVFGATPRGKVAIVAGTKGGTFVNPGSTCNGITLDLKPPFLPGFPLILNADGNGRVIVSSSLVNNLCGRINVQAVDLTTCNVSNIVKN